MTTKKEEKKITQASVAPTIAYFYMISSRTFIEIWIAGAIAADASTWPTGQSFDVEYHRSP